MEGLTRVGTTEMGSHSESGRVNLKKLVIVVIDGSLRTVVMLKSD